MTEAEAKRAMVAYGGVLISWLIRIKELRVKVECFCEKDTCQGNKRLEGIWKHKPGYN